MRIGEALLKKKQMDRARENFKASRVLLERLSTESPLNMVRRNDLNTVKTHLVSIGEA